MILLGTGFYGIPGRSRERVWLRLVAAGVIPENRARLKDLVGAQGTHESRCEDNHLNSNNVNSVSSYCGHLYHYLNGTSQI